MTRFRHLPFLVLAALVLTPQPLLAQKRTEVLDITHLPLGDGRVSTSPEAGYIFSCTTVFNGGGASGTPTWIHGDTWDLTAKPTVEGEVTWPEAQFAITVSGDQRLITGNALPVDTETGNFPIAANDPAYQFDRNPNTITPQTVSLSLPLNPQLTTPSCVPMGMIGVALNGVAIFNGLDDVGRDAVAHEMQDLCSGHPQMRGVYHYHGPSPCLPDEDGLEVLIGYALDGFGIYSIYDADGVELTNADLDECHGRTSEVIWNGEMVSIYHYVLTREYPYFVGCFRGTPA
jgi:hypothetical protein